MAKVVATKISPYHKHLLKMIEHIDTTQNVDNFEGFFSPGIIITGGSIRDSL